MPIVLHTIRQTELQRPPAVKVRAGDLLSDTRREGQNGGCRWFLQYLCCYPEGVGASASLCGFCPSTQTLQAPAPMNSSTNPELTAVERAVFAIVPGVLWGEMIISCPLTPPPPAPPPPPAAAAGRGPGGGVRAGMPCRALEAFGGRRGESENQRGAGRPGNFA